MRLPAAESVDGVRTGREVPGSSPAAQDYFGRDSLSAEGRDTEGGRKDKAGRLWGRSGAFLALLGGFLRLRDKKSKTPSPGN